MPKPGRPGASRGKKKGPAVGTGGHGRKALEGRGPTPKAEDREYHTAHKRKAAAERAAAKSSNGQTSRARAPRRTDDTEIVTGRNSVVEALRARIPATALYIATTADLDDRMRESIALANKRGLTVLEITRPEIDRMSGQDAVHQGIALKVPPYEYAHPDDLVARATAAGQTPLIVALDGVTDPRNLGAIIRSAAAFGGHGVVVPSRRSVGMTASAWKSAAGAAARVPVAQAGNLTAQLKAYQQQGLFVIGLDAAGETALPGLELAPSPLVIVTGSEGAGLSRLVRETCDALVAIPIDGATESLNASVATAICLYEVARLRGE